MLENLMSACTALVGVLVALWRFSESPLGKELVAFLHGARTHKASEMLSEAAFCLVAKYQQTLVNGLKQDATDGVITKEELKARLGEIKKNVLQDFKTATNGSALGVALEALRVPDQEAHLDQLLESAIVRLKSQLPANLAAALETKKEAKDGDS